MNVQLVNKHWQTFAKKWAMYGPPVKPSKSEVRIWEKYLSKSVGTAQCAVPTRTLILGSTPELRDLCHKLKHKDCLSLGTGS